MKQEIRTYFEAGYGALYAVSHEEDRVSATIAKTAKNMKYRLWSWTITSGLCDATGTPIDKTSDPLLALAAFIKYDTDGKGNPTGTVVPNKSVVIFKDLHMYLKNPPPPLIRRLKEAIKIGRSTNRHIIIIGPVLNLPTELEKEITVIEFDLPTREELKEVAEKVARDAGIVMDNVDAVTDAMAGLTTTEAEDAASWSCVANKRKSIAPEPIARIKADTIKKNGVIEVVETTLSLEDMAGNDAIKAHMRSICTSFTQAARDYGLPSPRPVVLCGQPGTGKSMLMLAIQSLFKIPLLRLEAGRIFAGLVGGSEENWRKAFAAARAIAPVIFWIDEAEALFEGGKSSGVSDGGTTGRVIKTILQDMQFNGEGIFFGFTSNEIDGFPDALIDRCEVWSFDLPTLPERKESWNIHIEKRKRKASDYDTAGFAAWSEGYSHRQIEQAWLQSMRMAFNDGGREPTNQDVRASLDMLVPTSVTMADQIARRTQRLKGKARPASTPVQQIQEQQEPREFARQLAEV